MITPDPYDLVLSKCVRCEEQDVGAIVEINKNYPLDLDVLVERSERDFLPYVIGDHKKIALNIVMVMAHLFGMEVASQVALHWEVEQPRGLLPTATSKGEMRRKARARWTK